MVYSYVSTRADYDPAKLFLVCPPAENATDEKSAAAFAESSGWQALAEWEGGILLIPVVPNGWQAENTDLPACTTACATALQPAMAAACLDAAASCGAGKR